MAKNEKDFRFKAPIDIADWIYENAEAEDLPIHVFIRRQMREAMKRQTEYNSKWIQGDSQGKPGVLRADGYSGPERRKVG